MKKIEPYERSEHYFFSEAEIEQGAEETDTTENEKEEKELRK